MTSKVNVFSRGYKDIGFQISLSHTDLVLTNDRDDRSPRGKFFSTLAIINLDE